jgi:Pyruvate/2-oxoacid:ferredoxin oxidoreductase delta subunit
VPTYQALCDKAITLENTVKQVERRKRKHDKHGSGPPRKMRSYDEGSESCNHEGGNRHQHRNENDHHNNGHKNFHNSERGNGSHNGGHNGNNHNNSHRFAKRDISQIECYKCKKLGHFANYCPKKTVEKSRKAEEIRKPNPFQKGHVNHVNVEELYDEPDAVIGKFRLNNFTAHVLFDIGASHSFISRVFVDKNNLATETIG